MDYHTGRKWSNPRVDLYADDHPLDLSSLVTRVFGIIRRVVFLPLSLEIKMVSNLGHQSPEFLRLGDQNLDSLQRLYGIAFPNDKLLKARLTPRHGS